MFLFYSRNLLLAHSWYIHRKTNVNIGNSTQQHNITWMIIMIISLVAQHLGECYNRGDNKESSYRKHILQTAGWPTYRWPLAQGLCRTSRHSGRSLVADHKCYCMAARRCLGSQDCRRTQLPHSSDLLSIRRTHYRPGTCRDQPVHLTIQRTENINDRGEP